MSGPYKLASRSWIGTVVFLMSSSVWRRRVGFPSAPTLNYPTQSNPRQPWSTQSRNYSGNKPSVWKALLRAVSNNSTTRWQLRSITFICSPILSPLWHFIRGMRCFLNFKCKIRSKWGIRLALINLLNEFWMKINKCWTLTRQCRHQSLNQLQSIRSYLIGKESIMSRTMMASIGSRTLSLWFLIKIAGRLRHQRRAILKNRPNCQRWRTCKNHNAIIWPRPSAKI